MRALTTVELLDLLTDFGGGAPEEPTLRDQSQPPKQTDVELRDIEHALSYIPADAPRGIGSIIGQDGSPLEDYWFGVILAIRRAFGSQGEIIARKWSETSERYTPDGFDQAWSAYDPDHPNPVTIKSVLKLAMANGWQGNLGGALPRVPRLDRFKRLDRAEILAIPPMQWRVKGLFPVAGIGAMFGPSGSAKSFLVIDLAITTALGRVWFGYRTLPCHVTYVMLEGEAGLRGRVVAWEKHNAMKIPDTFHVITEPFEIANDNDVEDLAASLPKYGVLIIDTLNRAAPGLDENSSKDMSILLKGMKRLQEVTGGLVIAVHHTGKDTTKGMRGHSSLNAALDGAIEVTRNGPLRTWSASKVKDGRDGGSKAFKLHEIPLGKDSDGDLTGSCAIGWSEDVMVPETQPSGHAQRAALKLIRVELAKSVELDRAGGAGPCIRVEDAIELVAGSLVAHEKKRRRNRARTLVQDLLSGGYMQTGTASDDECWLWK